MPDVQRLKTELLREAAVYSQYLERAVRQRETDIPYPLNQLVELQNLINTPLRIKAVHRDVSQHLERHLRRPFGEAVRGAFSNTHYPYDLHNNLKRILTSPRYDERELNHAEDLYELEERFERRFEEQRNQCTPCQEAKKEKARLEALNGELQARIDQITQELNRMRQERDQWKQRCETLNQQNNTLRAEKAQGQAEVYTLRRENGELKTALNRTYCEQAQQQMPKGTPHSRRV